MDEWIWVDGYKVTGPNMQAYGGFQYEINKLYHQDGEIEICKNGFHFCLELRDTWKYIGMDDPLKARFFKCKGLVRSENVAEYGRIVPSFYALTTERIDKVVAKEILLTEEITDTKEITDLLAAAGNFRFLEVLPKRPRNLKEYTEDAKKMIWDTLTQYDYSEAFLNVLFDKPDYPYKLYLHAKAYGEEGLSHDMRAYLLTQLAESKN